MLHDSPTDGSVGDTNSHSLIVILSLNGKGLYPAKVCIAQIREPKRAQ